MSETVNVSWIARQSREIMTLQNELWRYKNLVRELSSVEIRNTTDVELAAQAAILQRKAVRVLAGKTV